MTNESLTATRSMKNLMTVKVIMTALTKTKNKKQNKTNTQKNFFKKQLNILPTSSRFSLSNSFSFKSSCRIFFFKSSSSCLTLETSSSAPCPPMLSLLLLLLLLLLLPPPPTPFTVAPSPA
jgi:hypothetical protein